MCKQRLWHHYRKLERGISPGGAPAWALLWPSIVSLAGRAQAAGIPPWIFNLVLQQQDKQGTGHTSMAKLAWRCQLED